MKESTDSQVCYFTSAHNPFCRIENYRGYQEGKLKLPANIELCKIGNACPNACPEEYSLKPGAKYTISQTVHTIMSVPHTYPVSTASTNLHKWFSDLRILISRRTGVNVKTPKYLRFFVTMTTPLLFFNFTDFTGYHIMVFHFTVVAGGTDI